MSCEGCTGCSIPDKMVKIAEKYRDVDGGIISALHEMQDEYGYISETAQKYLSKELNVPMSDIYGIITFYSRFTLVPKGKYNIQICLGTACFVKGATEIEEKFKEELGLDKELVTKDCMFSIEEVRCIGACGLAPAITVNGEVYGKFSADKVPDLIKKYREL